MQPLRQRLLRGLEQLEDDFKELLLTVLPETELAMKIHLLQRAFVNLSVVWEEFAKDLIIKVSDMAKMHVVRERFAVAVAFPSFCFRCLMLVSGRADGGVTSPAEHRGDAPDVQRPGLGTRGEPATAAGHEML